MKVTSEARQLLPATDLQLRCNRMAKERLLVEIDKELRGFAKQYAASRRITLSELIEELLRELRDARNAVLE